MQQRAEIQNKSWSHLLPSEDLDICEENLELFFKTMFDRQNVWNRRFMLKKDQPWTSDEILANNKFTNVYRELDRNSQYQIENIISKETNRKELIWKIIFFRFFNQPEFFKFIEHITMESEELGSGDFSFRGIIPNYDEFNSDELKSLMEAYRSEGGNPFTNAYLTNSQACPGCTRDHCFAYTVIPAVHAMIPQLSKLLLTAKKPEEIIKLLNTLPSVSNFVSHEFYQDFTYATRYSKIKLMKFDQNDFTNVGPGAKIGIRLIFPSLPLGKAQLEAIYTLRDIAPEMLSKYGKFKYLNWDSENKRYYTTSKGEVTLHQIEMWLCEFQKYWKMKIGLGKQRSSFVAKTIVK